MPSSNGLRWFRWGSTVAVIAPDESAFSIGAKGWIPVNSADVGWDGLPIPEADARVSFESELAAFGEPPVKNPNLTFSPLAAIALARAAQRVARKHQDADLASRAQDYERRATVAADLGLPEMPKQDG